jgi:MFS family permease
MGIVRDWQRRSPVLSDAQLTRYLLAAVVSMAGTAVSMVALPILVYQRSGSPVLTAALTAIDVVPYVALGPLAGPLADRVSRRRLMVTGNCVSAAAMLSIPLTSQLGMLTVPQVYAVAVVTAVCFVFTDAADFGALPALAGRDRLVAAWSMLSGSTAAVLAVGPGLGGVLIAVAGAPWTVTVDGVSYLAAAFLIAGVAGSFGGAGGRAQGGGMLTQFREALSWLWGHRIVRTLTVVGFGKSVSGGVVMGLTVVYAVRVLGLSPRDGLIGLLYAAGALGAVGGSAIMGRLRKVLHPAWIALASTIATSLLVLALARPWPGLAGAVLLFALASMAGQISIVNGITYRQQVIPDELQSRVNVIARMIGIGGTPLGAVAGGLMTEAWSVPAAFIAAAAVLALTAAAGYPSLRAAAREDPGLSG